MACDEIRTDCALHFAALEEMARDVKEIRLIVCGDGNGRAGLGEKLRTHDRAIEDLRDDLGKLETRSWGNVKKLGFVIVVAASLIGAIVQILGK